MYGYVCALNSIHDEQDSCRQQLSSRWVVRLSDQRLCMVEKISASQSFSTVKNHFRVEALSRILLSHPHDGMIVMKLHVCPLA